MQRLTSFKHAHRTASNSSYGFFHGPGFVQARRSIVHLKSYDHSLFKSPKNTIPPLYGAYFYQSGGVERLYLTPPPQDEINSALFKLTHLLFHKSGVTIHATQNKSYAAYALNPHLIAKLTCWLDGRDSPHHREAIIALWQERYHALTDCRLSRAKINHFLDTLDNANRFSQQQGLSPWLPHLLLISFLHVKAQCPSEIITYQNALHFEKNSDLPAHETFPSTREAWLENLSTEALSSLSSHDIESLIYTLLLRNKPLDRVMMSHYRYKQKPPRPNCIEVALHNFCNILLYDTTTGRFDFSRLPIKLPPSSALYQFYEKQRFETEIMHTYDIGQDFMNLISGHPSLQYVHDDYELLPGSENFLLAINVLFELQAKNFSELSSLLSTEARQIHFRALNDYVVEIKLIEGSMVQHLTYQSEVNHGELQWEHPKLTPQCSKLRMLGRECWHNLSYHPILFPLLESTNRVDYPFHHQQIDAISIPTKLSYFYLFHQHYKNLYPLIKLSLQQGNPFIMAFVKQALTKRRDILHLCVIHDDFDIATVAIPYYGNLNMIPASSRQPLIHSAKSEAMLALLLENGACPNAPDERGDRLLHKINNAAMAKLLLAHHANPNLTNEHLETPLFCIDDLAVLELLLKHGANPNAKSWAGGALHHTKSIKKAALLLSYGANPNLENQYQETPLHKAKSIEMARLLLEHGANPNTRDTYGNTPLHQAKSLEMVKILVDHGADWTMANVDGETPLDTLWCPKARAYLMEHASSPSSRITPA